MMCGTISTMLAVSKGPGGPIQALLTTSIIYHCSINAIWFGQGLSSFEAGGIIFGVLATTAIALGDPLIKKCSGEKPADGKNEALLGKTETKETR